jgi:hypothetical protein
MDVMGKNLKAGIEKEWLQASLGSSPEFKQSNTAQAINSL